MPPSIYVTITYDYELEKITRVRESPIVVTAGQTFPFVLMNVFIEHPELQAYKPGELGFLINGIPPSTRTIIRDGDTIAISAHIYR